MEGELGDSVDTSTVEPKASEHKFLGIQFPGLPIRIGMIPQKVGRPGF